MILFAPTEIGKPSGELIKQIIGPAGGGLTSSDNKVELNIPAGALSSETMITIQSFTNPGENGVGMCYSFEPSGTQFHLPVQLVLHYTNEQLNGDSPNLMTICTQNEKGVWYRLRKVTLDTAAKIITGNINHFSLWALRWYSVLEPDNNSVKVSKSVSIFFWFYPIDGEGTAEDARDMVNDMFGSDFSKPRTWSVNGIAGGNSEVGTIESNAARWAHYTAPANIPDQNPVEVMIEIAGGNIGPGDYENYKKKCKITVYDDRYQVNMTALLKGGSPKAWTGEVTYKDEGSFIVSLEKNSNPALINIKNKLELFTNNCTKTILNPATCTGLLHVVGARQIKVTPANPPVQPYRIVEIWFLPHPIELTRYTQTCPPPPGIKESVTATIDLSQMAMMMFMGKPAIPQYIKFIANDEEQIILESPRGISEIYYKIWVKKIKEE